MTSIAKLKDRARKHEQKEDWKAAIEAYQEVLSAEEKGDELELELGLFNRIGDLYLRLGQTDDAVSYYEQAADKYAEAGFFNNAIALCNKALRHRPERPQIYLKLSRLCAEQGFVTDARRWILDYAEREVKGGRVDAALTGLREFVDTSGDPDVREFLAHQLSTQGEKQEAAEQYAQAYTTRMERGETDAANKAAERARALDPAVELAAAAPRAAPAEEESDGAEESGGLAGLETSPAPAGGGGIEVGGLDGLESGAGAVGGLEGALDEGPAGGADEEMAGLEVGYSERAPEATPDEVADASLGGLETFGEVDFGGTLDEDVGAAATPEDAEPLPLMEDEGEPLPLLDMDTPAEPLPGLPDEEEGGEPLPLLDFGAEEEAAPAVEEPAGAGGAVEAGEQGAGAFDLGALDLGTGTPAAEPPAGAGAPARSEVDLSLDVAGPPSPPAAGGPPATGPGPKPAPEPEAEPEMDTEAILKRARELVSRGLATASLQELQVLSTSDAGPDVFRAALAVVTEILRHDQEDLAALHQRVEFAARAGDEAQLLDAYLGLAEALSRTGAETKAHAMYERVLGMDPSNATALAALGRQEAPEEEETVDLDAILREMGPEELAATAPVTESGADPAFAAMLSRFKAKVTDHPESEDAGDHYDLGLAFKEMGLIDEAIAEFQTALTGGEERLKVYEELGQCFILKGQYNLALKIFARALQVPAQSSTELLGVYYHLGQIHEEMGQRDKAREAYAKVLTIDPSFQDVPDRLARL